MQQIRFSTQPPMFFSFASKELENFVPILFITDKNGQPVPGKTPFVEIVKFKIFFLFLILAL